MASNDTNNNDLAYADTLWKSADTLRGQIDAAEYKHIVHEASNEYDLAAQYLLQREPNYGAVSM